MKVSSTTACWVCQRCLSVLVTRGPPIELAADPLLSRGGRAAPIAVSGGPRACRRRRVLDIAGGALVVATSGHPDGSMALLLWRPRVLFTGDAITESDGRITLGPFNRDRGAASFRTLAELDVDVACFGHDTSVVGDEAAANMIMLWRLPCTLAVNC